MGKCSICDKEMSDLFEYRDGKIWYLYFCEECQKKEEIKDLISKINLYWKLEYEIRDLVEGINLG